LSKELCRADKSKRFGGSVLVEIISDKWMIRVNHHCTPTCIVGNERFLMAEWLDDHLAEKSFAAIESLLGLRLALLASDSQELSDPLVVSLDCPLQNPPKRRGGEGRRGCGDSLGRSQQVGASLFLLLRSRGAGAIKHAQEITADLLESG